MGIKKAKKKFSWKIRPFPKNISEIIAQIPNNRVKISRELISERRIGVNCGMFHTSSEQIVLGYMASWILEWLWTTDCYVLSIFLILNGSNYGSYSTTVSMFYTGWLWAGGVNCSPDWEEMCLRSFIHIWTWCRSWNVAVPHDAIIEKDFGGPGRSVWCSFHIGWMWIEWPEGRVM